MSNPNPTKARQAKRQKRAKAPGDIAALRQKLWDLLERLHREIEGSGDGMPEGRLRHVHAVIQLSGVYIRATEAGEIEARLAALEEEILGRKGA